VAGIELYPLKKYDPGKKSRGSNIKKIDYVLFTAVITKSPITDAITVMTGGKGDFVVVGTGFGTVVVTTDGIVVTGAVVVFSTTTVVNDTGGALPRWDVDPVLKTLSEPNWFETVNRTS